MARNVASGDDRVDLQVGKVGGKRPQDDGKDTAKGRGKTTNICTGNARVGVQTDVVNGDLTIRWER